MTEEMPGTEDDDRGDAIQAGRFNSGRRTTKVNTPDVVSEALKLKWQIEHWRTDGWFVAPEDPSSEIQHSIETAEAYRWATLLYLHQAVPELPSMTTAQLAQRVLMRLAAVPSTSRTVIIQIYPLLVAGSEASTPLEREWVEKRWASMTARMWIGNVDRCREVIQEVWRRRDLFDFEQSHLRSTTSSITNNPIYPASSAHQVPLPTPTLPTPTLPTHADLGLNLLPSRKRPIDLLEAAYPQKRTAVSLPDNDEASISTSTMAMPSIKTEEALETYEAMTQSVETIPLERTVRGRVHWAGVMRDWKWEVLLG